MVIGNIQKYWTRDALEIFERNVARSDNSSHWEIRLRVDVVR